MGKGWINHYLYTNNMECGWYWDDKSDRGTGDDGGNRASWLNMVNLYVGWGRWDKKRARP